MKSQNISKEPLIVKYKEISVVYPGFLGWGGSGSNGVRVIFFHWRNKKFSFFSISLAEPFYYRKSPFPDSFGGLGLGLMDAIEIYLYSY